MIKASDIKVGDSHEEVVIDDLSRTQIVMYAGASGDYNPLHTDDKFTTEVAGYPSVFAHGMLSMGMTGRVEDLRRALLQAGLPRRHADHHGDGEEHRLQRRRADRRARREHQGPERRCRRGWLRHGGAAGLSRLGRG